MDSPQGGRIAAPSPPGRFVARSPGPAVIGGLTARMLGASGALALTIGGAFAVLLLAILDVREATRLATSSAQTLAEVNQLERLIVELEDGERGFVLTHGEAFLGPWQDAQDTFPAQADALAQLVADNPQQQHQAQRIRDAGGAYILQYSIPTVQAARRGDPAASSVAVTADGKRRVDAIRGEFDRFTATERHLMTEREQAAAAAARRAVTAAAGGLSGSVLLIAIFSGYLTRAIVQPVRRAAGMADRLATGDLHTRMPQDGVAEIGGLQRSFNAMAGSLEEQRDELSRLAGEQAALRRVATLVARGVPQPLLFAAVADEVRRLLGADATRMLRYEPDGTAVVVAERSGQPLEIEVGGRVPLDGQNLPALVRQTGRPVRLDSLAGAPGYLAGLLRETGIRSGVAAPITVDDRLWGVMTAFSSRDEPLSPDAELRIADFTDLVATAIANSQARADLAASRARVVAATDQTRRRIERDLHDGVQQRLVSLALELRGAEALVPAHESALRDRLAAVGSGLTGALEDLREISRGIHPAILSEGGLRPALGALARRSAVPVELDVRVGIRLPQPVEVAGYYVVAEALTNAAKHARASFVRVEAAVAGGRLRLSVHDDGVGGADPARGSGLIGLADRVESLDGTITVTSPTGEGTTLRVELPVDDSG